METTDIYVVTNVWRGQASVVVGAAADLDDAQAIAERHGKAMEWHPWIERSEDVARFAVERHSIGLPVEQKIVRVPLAGVHKLAAARVSDPWHGRPNAAGAPTADDINRAWSGLR